MFVHAKMNRLDIQEQEIEPVVCGGILLQLYSISLMYSVKFLLSVFTRDNIPSRNKNLASLAKPCFPFLPSQRFKFHHLADNHLISSAPAQYVILAITCCNPQSTTEAVTNSAKLTSRSLKYQPRPRNSMMKTQPDRIGAIFHLFHIGTASLTFTSL